MRFLIKNRRQPREESGKEEKEEEEELASKQKEGEEETGSRSKQNKQENGEKSRRRAGSMKTEVANRTGQADIQRSVRRRSHSNLSLVCAVLSAFIWRQKLLLLLLLLLFFSVFLRLQLKLSFHIHSPLNTRVAQCASKHK